MSHCNKLPDSWITAKVVEVGTSITGNTPSTQNTENYGTSIPYIKPPQLVDKPIDFSREFLSEQGARLARVLPPFSVLVSCIGNLGKTGLNKIPVAANQQINAIVPFKGITSFYLFYQAQSHFFRSQLESKATATTISIVNKGNFETIEVNIAPLPEQNRIVARIEELFSELDKGIESLKTAQAQLKVYRQALLKHAFEGKLTTQWREENKDKLETADALLKRIQAERGQRYRQQLAEWEVAGKQCSKPKVPKILPPLTAKELGELPELPKGWGWGKYGDLCSIVRNGISEKPSDDSGTPIFRISAVRPLFIDMDDVRYIDNSTGRFNAYRIKHGDLIFTRYNGSRRYVGVCAEYRSHEERLFPDKLVQTRIFSTRLLSSYFEKALNSGASRHFVESKIRTTAGQAGVSGDDIKNVPVPICSTDEQAEIVALLESKLSGVDQLDQAIKTSLQHAEALRQSILKKAFSGQLVPQDPQDEPASVLLARIKAAKSTHANNKKGRT